MPRAVVTGGAGFIGSHLTDLLVAQGWDVVVVDELSTGARSNLNPQAEFIEGSILDRELLARTFEGAQYVFHLAALPRIAPSFEQPVEHEMVNVVGAIRCLEALRGSTTIRRLVYSGSSACYGTPERTPTNETAPIRCLSPYALQKYAGEQYSFILGDRYGIPAVSLRYFNVYGPRSFSEANPYSAYTPVVGVFDHLRRSGKPLTITGDGTQARDFVHVHDVARANLHAALDGRSGEAYNIGYGTALTINEVASLFRHPIVYIAERRGEAMITLADIAKARRELGWEPTIALPDAIAAYDRAGGIV